MSTGAWPAIHGAARFRPRQDERLCRCSAVQMASLQAWPVRCFDACSGRVPSCLGCLDKDSAVSVHGMLLIRESVVFVLYLSQKTDKKGMAARGPGIYLCLC